MNYLHSKGLRALELLQERQLSLEDLTEQLCVCRRNVQKIIKHLKIRGFDINSSFKGKTKYFWTASDPDLLLFILTPAEKQALTRILTAQDHDLKTAFDKLTQYTLIQLYFQSTK